MKSKEKLIAEIITAQNGKAVTVKFRKRTDGSMRILNGRLGVKTGVKGEGLKFNPKDYSLLSIYDLQKKAFRFVSLDTVREVKAGGVTHKFKVKP